MSAIHTLTIPDDLLAWAQQPEVSVHFARPWAEEVSRIVADADDGPVEGPAVERLLARLEALCAEAIRHGRQELLLGFDLFTADWLGLTYTFDMPEGPLVFGRGAKWSYGELHVLARSGVPAGSGEAEHAGQCKDLMASAFPGARIDAIIDPREDSSDACDGCGTKDAVVMMTMEHGSQYCGRCWEDLVED